MQLIKIAAIEDCELIRIGLRTCLQAEPDMEVVGDAPDVASAVHLLARTPVDLLILGMPLDEDAGLRDLANIREKFSQLPVLAMSAHPEERMAIPALKLGAAGIVCKNTRTSEMLAGIRKIMLSGRYISPATADLLAREIGRSAALPMHQYLTKRELDVLRSLAVGTPIKQIAAQLGLSISSINTYRTRIFKKMGLHSNAALIRYAVEHYLIG